MRKSYPCAIDRFRRAGDLGNWGPNDQARGRPWGLAVAQGRIGLRRSPTKRSGHTSQRASCQDSLFQCPMPYSPMPQCPMPNAPFPIPYSPFPIPHAHP
ncbi:MAG: hypothetical protein F6J93_40355 [Oscillatoria sp. SIO1A7]|nr:hypothetical protein [Oscillatoria sp. SIO1A7]